MEIVLVLLLAPVLRRRARIPARVRHGAATHAKSGIAHGRAWARGRGGRPGVSHPAHGGTRGPAAWSFQMRECCRGDSYKSLVPSFLRSPVTEAGSPGARICPCLIRTGQRCFRHPYRMAVCRCLSSAPQPRITPTNLPSRRLCRRSSPCHDSQPPRKRIPPCPLFGLPPGAAAMA